MGFLLEYNGMCRTITLFYCEIFMSVALTHCPLFMAHGCLLKVLHCYHHPLLSLSRFACAKKSNLPLDILY